MKKVSSLLAVVMVVFCLTSMAFAQGKTDAKASDKPIGGAIVEVTKITATVVNIDLKTRIVTLKGPEGNTATFEVSEDVKNLDKVKAGDKVVVKYLESIAVFVRKTSDPPSVGELDAVGVAPKGAKPGLVMVQTDEITAKVKAVDVKKRTITLTGPEGKTKKFKVDKRVERLNEIKKGDDITLRITQALAIDVVKP
jgi:DNA-binding beta-propeller fold protein YncE